MSSERGQEHVVEFLMPAASDFVATVRLLAASLGALCQLTVDDIDDLRLVVDEALSLVLSAADPAGVVHIRFELSSGCLAVHASAPARGSAEVDLSGFAWTVLHALADTVEIGTTDGRVSVGLTKRVAQPA